MNKYYSFPGGIIIDNEREWNWVYYFWSGGSTNLNKTNKYTEGLPRIRRKEILEKIGRKKLTEIIKYIHYGKTGCYLA
jgi:hypothetical protein